MRNISIALALEIGVKKLSIIRAQHLIEYNEPWTILPDDPVEREIVMKEYQQRLRFNYNGTAQRGKMHKEETHYIQYLD